MKTEDITTKFREIEASSPKLLLKVSGKLFNLHGQYATRLQQIQSTVYSHADVTASEKDEVAKSAKLSRVKDVEVHTFPKNGNGAIIAPFGGNRGYLKGALRMATGKYGAERAKRTSPVYGLKTKLDTGVFIEPEWIELGENFSNPKEGPARFFLTNVGVYEFYDYIKEVPFEVNLRVETDIGEEILLSLLAFAQRVGMGPKRRGLMRIERVEKISA